MRAAGGVYSPIKQHMDLHLLFASNDNNENHLSQNLRPVFPKQHCLLYCFGGYSQTRLAKQKKKKMKAVLFVKFYIVVDSEIAVFWAGIFVRHVKELTRDTEINTKIVQSISLDFMSISVSSVNSLTCRTKTPSLNQAELNCECQRGRRRKERKKKKKKKRFRSRDLFSCLLPYFA